jgi:hypothetical protein
VETAIRPIEADQITFYGHTLLAVRYAGSPKFTFWPPLLAGEGEEEPLLEPRTATTTKRVSVLAGSSLPSEKGIA